MAANSGTEKENQTIWTAEKMKKLDQYDAKEVREVEKAMAKEAKEGEKNNGPEAASSSAGKKAQAKAEGKKKVESKKSKLTATEALDKAKSCKSKMAESIDVLRAEREKLKKLKHQHSKNIKAATRRVKVLKAKAMLLTNNDLMEVFQLRQEKEMQDEERKRKHAALEDGKVDGDNAAARKSASAESKS